MPNRNRTAGHDAEREVAKYLRANGYPLATTSRAALGHDGTKQIGDVIGVPGVSLEVKNRRNLALDSALMQAAIQGGPEKVALVVVKPYRVGDVGDWWAVTYMRHMIGLLPETGDL